MINSCKFIGLVKRFNFLDDQTYFEQGEKKCWNVLDNKLFSSKQIRVPSLYRLK